MAWKEAFLGFEFKGIHSSEFNIIRTIEGNRLKKDLLPKFSAITQDIPGADGTYYFGAKVEGSELSISFAFDSMTEEQYTKLRKFVNDKSVGKLVLDENDDKYYMAKISGSSSLKHLAFSEDGKRVYKGSGSINFTLLNPYLAREVSPTWTKAPKEDDENMIIYKCAINNDGWEPAEFVLEFSTVSKISVSMFYDEEELALNNLNKNTYNLDTKKRIIVDQNGVLWNSCLKKDGVLYIPKPFKIGKHTLQIVLEKEAEAPKLTYYCKYGM